MRFGATSGGGAVERKQKSNIKCLNKSADEDMG
jgi:hypothetical protein